MEKIRKPFQGVFNIIRFNWHFYLFALAFALFSGVSYFYLPGLFRFFAAVLFSVTILTTFITLGVSFYVYDLSKLYKFDWLTDFDDSRNDTIVNINAGFDETSEILRDKFRDSKLLVFDFYDPAKHTEVSIKRARKAYPPYFGTQQITTGHLPLADVSADKIFAILSAHEIRNDAERRQFFMEISRSLKTDGNLFIVEHLRDLPNLLAYNIGFFHFLSKQTWLATFSAANLKLRKEIKITPFISVFILEKNGVSS